MPLTREELEALDPADPVDAAVLQAEALHYIDETGALGETVTELETENEDLVVQVEEVSEDYNAARREAANLRIAQSARPSKAIKSARRG